jgi:hypothetical protein
MIRLASVNESNQRTGIRENHLPLLLNKVRLKATPLLRARPPLDFIRPMKGAKLSESGGRNTSRHFSAMASRMSLD